MHCFLFHSRFLVSVDWVVSYFWGKDYFSNSKRYNFFDDKFFNVSSNVNNFWKTFQKWNHFKKFLILRIFIPWFYWNSILRMKREALRHVVNNDDILKRSAKIIKIFQKEASCIWAIFSKKSEEFIWNKLLQFINDLICINRLTCSENYNFIKFGNLFKELF